MQKTKSILFINDTSRNGGPGRSLYYILKFLDSSKIRRHVLLPRPGMISEMYVEAGVTESIQFESRLIENLIEPWHRAMRREDFEVSVPTKMVRLIGNLLRGSFGFFHLAKIIKKTDIDLVYCNGTNACFLGGALSAVFHIPALWHVRYSSVPKMLEPVHQILASGKYVRRIICVSHTSAALFPYCLDKVKVIHNALDVDEFSSKHITGRLRAELGVSDDIVIFGSHGRILPRKGYMEMVEAAALTVAELKKEERSKIRFVVLGDTPQDMRPNHLDECRERVRQLGLEDTFCFLGFKPDVKPYVVDFDVAVVPSVYADPLPRAVIESMAFGRPVIAFDVGGVSEMLKEGESGALVPLNVPSDGSPNKRERELNIQKLAEQMIRYAKDRTMRISHGQEARKVIESKFSAQKQAKEIEIQILEACIG